MAGKLANGRTLCRNISHNSGEVHLRVGTNRALLINYEFIKSAGGRELLGDSYRGKSRSVQNFE